MGMLEGGSTEQKRLGAGDTPAEGDDSAESTGSSLSAEDLKELEDLDLGILSSNIGSELSDAEMDAMIEDASFN